MSAKEQFLQKLKEQIKVLQDAYDSNSKLPDSFFELIFPVSNHTKTINVIQPFSSILDKTSEIFDYGKNKKAVLKIIEDAGHVVIKSFIVEIFSKATGIDEGESMRVITNALAALSQDGAVIGYKADSVRMRGNFWGLKKWFENDKLKEEYKPLEEREAVL
jgi:hypothetical protein